MELMYWVTPAGWESIDERNRSEFNSPLFKLLCSYSFNNSPVEIRKMSAFYIGKPASIKTGNIFLQIRHQERNEIET